MNPKDVLLSVLKDVSTDCPLTVSLSSYPRKQDVPEYRTLNIKAEVSGEFLTIVRNYCSGIADEIKSNDLVLNLFDLGIPHMQPHEVEWFDSGSDDKSAAHIAAVIGSVHHDAFGGQKEFLNNLHSYAIMLEIEGEQPIIFYRKYNPARELARSLKLIVFDNQGSYDKVRDTTFVLDHKIDCFSRGSLVFVTSKRESLAIFRLYEVLRSSASTSLAYIEATVPIANFEAFATRCQGDMVRLAQINSIVNDGYLDKLTVDQIKATIDSHSIEGIKFVDEDGSEKMIYDEAYPWAILEVLRDLHTTSPMTGRKFKASSQRTIDAKPPAPQK